MNTTPVSRLLVLSAGLLTSCTIPKQPVQLYAVKGAELSQAPHISGIVAPQGPYSGTFQITWPSGETGIGHYSGIANFTTSATLSSVSGSGSLYGNVGITPVMASAYHSAWGSSFTSTLSAQRIPITGMLVTNTGRRVEFMGAAGSGTDHGFGVAQDNRGNVWKVIF